MDTTPCFPHIGYKLLIRLRSGRVIHSEQCKNNRRVQVNMQIRIISCCFSCKNRACFTILLAASAETNEYSSVFNSPCSLMKLYQPYSDDAMPSCSLTFSPDNIFSSVSSKIPATNALISSEDISISCVRQYVANSLINWFQSLLKSVSLKRYLASSFTTTLYFPWSSTKLPF